MKISRICMLVGLTAMLLIVPLGATEAVTLHVAPKALGKCDGSGAEHAAALTDKVFWSNTVRPLLAKKPVTVQLAPGTYLFNYDSAKKINTTLILEKINTTDNRLVITGAPDEKTILRRDPSDPKENVPGNRPGLFQIHSSKNITISNLHFRGKESIGYVTSFRNCQDILIEDCSWIDMPGVYYAASGCHYEKTDGITWKNCTFKRVGFDGHAHFLYNCWNPKNINVINCHFEDCRGDYIRFRNGSDFASVQGSTFISNGTFGVMGLELPFISVPLFNDKNPADNPEKLEYEYFGTNFEIRDNTFIYPEQNNKKFRKIVLSFLHNGWNPPGRRHLLSEKDAEFLRTAPKEKRAAYYLEKMGIDVNKIIFANNRVKNATANIAYESWAAFGAESSGWGGWGIFIPLSDLVKTE